MTQQARLRFYIITFPTQACVFFTQLDTRFWYLILISFTYTYLNLDSFSPDLERRELT